MRKPELKSTQVLGNDWNCQAGEERFGFCHLGAMLLISISIDQVKR